MLISITKTPHGSTYLFRDESGTTREVLTDADGTPQTYIRRTPGCLPTISTHEVGMRLVELKSAMEAAIDASFP